ncbi:LpxT activity modulator PmrR, partial [Escherichia coli]
MKNRVYESLTTVFSV